MTYVSRRSLLRGGAAAAAGLAVAGPFSGFVAHAQRGQPRSSGYGPLVAVPDTRDGVVRLELPEGFQYRSFHHAGDVMGDGSVVPARHDGMAAFSTRPGRTTLVRNHEINGNTNVASSDIRLGSAPGYDPIAKGGTATVVVNANGKVFDSYVSLTGTQMNCAGGTTPWGTWLSCEETVNGADVGPDFTGASNAGLAKHGYMYEVPSSGVSAAVPITAAGRFAKEAAAVDPGTGVIYITEDSFLFPSGLYRYLPAVDPRSSGSVGNEGLLQMLKVAGEDNADLSDDEEGNSYQAEWVDIPDPDPDMTGLTNNEAIQVVGAQGFAQGAAIFSRLEGAIWWKGKLFFTSTQGGEASDPIGGDSYNVVVHGFGRGRGQVWSYDPVTGTLTCVYQSPDSMTLDLPDNITTSASGALVLCEDGSGDNFLRGLTMSGELFTFARNADPLQAGQEFAGATFSANYHTLFVNLQSGVDTRVPRLGGYSIAIWGPWARGPF